MVRIDPVILWEIIVIDAIKLVDRLAKKRLLLNLGFVIQLEWVRARLTLA